MWNNGVHGTRSARRDCGKDICKYAKKRMDYIHPFARSLHWWCLLSDMSESVRNTGNCHSLVVLVIRLATLQHRLFSAAWHRRACVLLLIEQQGRRTISDRAIHHQAYHSVAMRRQPQMLQVPQQQCSRTNSRDPHWYLAEKATLCSRQMDNTILQTKLQKKKRGTSYLDHRIRTRVSTTLDS